MIHPHKLIFLKVFAIFVSFKCAFSSTCNFITVPEYSISLKDFNVSRSTDKNYFCVAYFCSTDENEPMKAVVNSFTKKYDTLVYAGPLTVSFNQNCGNCPDNSTGSNETENPPGCSPCKPVEESPNYEIHFRVGNPLSEVSDGKPCELGNFFNITIQTKVKDVIETSDDGCKEGLLVNVPKGDVCDIISLDDSEEKCIKPTCSKNVIVKDATNHKFSPSTTPGVCIWKLATKGNRYLEFHFSPGTRDKLILFEETLLTPKWNLAKCSSISDTFKIKLPLNSLYIMYKSDQQLEHKPMFSIKFKKDLCPLPPIIDNAKEEFFRTDNGTISIYTCNKGFNLVGPKEISCVDDIWQTPPECILNNKNGLMSDDPESKDNASTIELDRGVEFPLLHLNTTSLEYDEGSGTLPIEYDSDVDAEGNFSSKSIENKENLLNKVFNISSSNETYSWEIPKDNIFVSVPNLEDNLILFIVVGVGIALIILITILSVILCRKGGSNMNRTFDTFQNPIYEKPVHRVPIARSDSDPGHEKVDLGDLSDSTVLDM